MQPPDAVGRCRSCPLQAPLWDGLCLHCWVRCAICLGRGRVRVVYGRTPSGHMERACQSCGGSSERKTSLPRRVLAELTPSEAEFQARVIRLAKAYGFACYHTHWSKHSEAGFPDLCMVRGPRLVFAELKVWPRLAPPPAQVAWLERLRAVPGVEVYLWAWEWPGVVEDEIAEVLR